MTLSLLAQRLLAAAPSYPVSRRRLEVLATRHGPLIYDDLASQRAVRELLNAGLLAYGDKTLRKYRLTPAGAVFLEESEP